MSKGDKLTVAEFEKQLAKRARRIMRHEKQKEITNKLMNSGSLKIEGNKLKFFARKLAQNQE